MRLEIVSFPVANVVAGPRTEWRDGTLTVDLEGLRAAVHHENLESVEIHLVNPGDPVRLIHVLDVVEPRAKVAGGTGAFPGFTDRARVAGEGVTHRLDGAAVIVCAEVTGFQDGLSVKEAIIDMVGPAARLSPFTETHNVVLVCHYPAGMSIPEQLATSRVVGLRAAEYLAEPVRRLDSPHREVFDLGSLARNGDRRLPRIVYISPLMHEGSVHNTYVYGVRVSSTPTVFHPNEMLDGAIVNADYHIAAYRSTTFHFQNNPLIRELYRRHGVDLDFVGVIICQCLIVSHLEKERSAFQVAKLCRLLGADGAVLSMQNGGHGWADLMLLTERVEEAGVKAVVVMAEMSDADGTDVGLIMHVPQADALVSVGNIDEEVELPAMPRVIGGTQFLDFNNYEGHVGARPSDAFRTALRRLHCPCNQVGYGRMAAQAQ
jgi:sarcosine reductase